MRRLRLAGFVVLVGTLVGAATAAGSAQSPAGTMRGAADRQTVKYPTPVQSSTVLKADHQYKIVARDTVGYWPVGSSEYPDAREGEGADALYCYVTWRCPKPELWRQLRINGLALDEFAGLTGKIPYDASHVYPVIVSGVTGKLTYTSAGGQSGGFTVEVIDLGAATKKKPKTCRAPLRLPASAHADTKCRYFVRFNFDALEVIPDVWVKRTKGVGAFYVELSADDSKACTLEGKMSIRNEFEPLQGKDRHIDFSSTDAYLCLSLKGRGTKLLTAEIYGRGSDNYRPDLCKRAYESGGRANSSAGLIDIRAGEPFNFVRIGLCGSPGSSFLIREKYSPVGTDHPAKVKVQINITPTGVK